MKICGIIFDKDGTLLDFNKFWVSVTDKAIDEILQKCGADISLKPKVLSELGVINSDVDITGQLCSGTYESMGRCIYETLIENGVKISENTDLKAVTVEAYHHNSQAGTVAPACDGLAEILKNLKVLEKSFILQVMIILITIFYHHMNTMANIILQS